MHLAIITAGGAGMFCGSCMHDNTWARALQAEGVEVSLIPTYTPIRVDEENVSMDRVFFGGINVYLKCRSRFWQHSPRFFRRWFDAAWLVNLATRFGISNDAHQLGAITLAMLQGESGPLQADCDALVNTLCDKLQPDVICFSNALLAGVLRPLKQRFPGPIWCTLQGDDIFLEALREPYRTQVIAEIREYAKAFDGFLVHSRYYRDFMADYLDLPVDRFHLLPLGIDLAGHDGTPKMAAGPSFTVGYFARICREKGLHNLVEAFHRLHERHPEARLRVGGDLRKQEVAYFQKLQRQARLFGSSFEYVGSPKKLAEKVDFLKSLDVLSVPTEYQEPKGLYVLEAWANGVPVVQPHHGTFPELIASTGGGLLFEPGNVGELARLLEELLGDEARRLALARAGHKNGRRLYNAQTMVQESITWLAQL